MIYEPAAWDILVRSVEATTEPGEDFQERVKQPPFHRAGISLHKNLRLAVISGENFTGILAESGEHAISLALRPHRSVSAGYRSVGG